MLPRLTAACTLTILAVGALCIWAGVAPQDRAIYGLTAGLVLGLWLGVGLAWWKETMV